MSDSLAGEYETEVAAQRIMRRLEEDFGEVSLIKVLSLLNRFLTSKMADNTSVNEHLNKLCVLNEELKNAGYPFSEEVQVMVALNSLLHTWEQFKISFCHSERLLNMRNLRHHLLMEEDRKTSQGKERHSHHQELHLGEDRRRWQKKNQGGDLRDKINRKRNWDGRNGRGPNSNLDKRNFKCHGCGEYGHFRTECKNKKPFKQDDKSKKQHQDKHHDKHQGNKKDNSSPGGIRGFAIRHSRRQRINNGRQRHLSSTVDGRTAQHCKLRQRASLPSAFPKRTAKKIDGNKETLATSGG